MACDNCSTTYTEPAGTEYKRSHQVVDTLPEADIFRNVLVSVREEAGAVYHVDEVGNYVCVSRSPLFEEGHDAAVGKYKNAVIYDFQLSKVFVYHPDGTYKTGVLA